MVFITVVESVYSAVGTDSLYKADYVVNWMVFITVVESVYSAVGLIPYIEQMTFRS
jgi:hypothetical protein